MAVAVPAVPLPPSMADKALPVLLKRLEASSSSALLSTALRALVIVYGPSAITSAAGPVPTLPLQVLLRSASSDAVNIPIGLLLDATVVYINYSDYLRAIWTDVLAARPEILDQLRSEIIPGIIERLRLSPSSKSLIVFAHTLRALSRSHEELFGLILSEAEAVVPALRDGYSSLATSASAKADRELDDGDRHMRAREAVLVLMKEMADALGPSADDGLKRLLRDPARRNTGQTGGTDASLDLRSGTQPSLLDDYRLAFEAGRVDDQTRATLQSQKEAAAETDPRLTPLLPIFPDLSPSLLLSALDHPAFAPSSSTTTFESAAAPLIDAIFSGGDALPEDLTDLRAAIRAMPREPTAQQGPSSSSSSSSAQPSVAREQPLQLKYERRNIFDNDELDFSRLRLGKDPLNLPQVGESIPDHLRESILRLVENQKIEAEAEARAIAEARGQVYRPPRDDHAADGDDLDDDAVKLRVRDRSGGDESGEEDESGDKVIERSGPGGPSVDMDVQTKLELAYLSDARIFDRDAMTRKSQARRQLKMDTGMDDSQLEGWRIMLDRNPHKEAILARHALVPRQVASLAQSRPDSAASGSRSDSSRGSGHGRAGGRASGSGGGGGPNGGSERGGGGRGGRGGGGNGGGVGGRGQNKGSRGHSNAARTRGHDRKMAKMGGP